MGNWENEGEQDEELRGQIGGGLAGQWQSQVPEVIKDVIPFEAKNKYMEEAGDRLGMAKELVENGRAQEAIVCLQAEVQKNAENAEAWRLMGQLYQENDQDDYAIIAFKRAYEIDPYDLDSLLCLGISCTNELEQKDAINHLFHWLKYHPDFNHLVAAIPESADNVDLEMVRAAYL